ncbi:SPOSA6832_02943 [Sporobolomyces salmonicolor]|uniref:SPOSA6832_02943-mRNA-1:cds n=1 Tax=Sporidiobolus salmonicolor TaxID=5005 RepID=A0A0D6EMY9_SPOSA|nr:SPOSA6832_02943 [Sporobolomyces salmonicolor]
MAETETYLVIGGEGFLGSTLVKALLARYPSSSVGSLDIVQRHFSDQLSTTRKWTFYSADLTSLPSLSAAIKQSGATTVFHTASPWTGSGAEVCEKVNVQGTQTVVDACVQEGVKKLVFTSSAGTVYNGVDLINVDERMPFPEEGLDPYNVTKAKAEKIVLEANGKGGLLTVALRPAGIFGPGDRQALPGVLEVLKSGKTKFQVGSNENLFDWTYVDNVVHAHLIASERLGQTASASSLSVRMPPVDLDVKRRELPTSSFRPKELLEREKEQNPEFKNDEDDEPDLLAGRNRFDQFYSLPAFSPPSSDSPSSPSPETEAPDVQLAIAGQAFFITNGEPIPFWDFPRAVWAAYNGHEPSFVVPLPVSVGLLAAAIGEVISGLLGKTPNLTKGKVVYSTVNRYYNIEKARRVLGYEPIVGLQEGIQRAVAWYKENEATVAAAAKPVKA